MVISPEELNKYLKTIVAAPMTTTSRKYPSRIEVKYDRKCFGGLSKSEIKEVKSVIKEKFVD